MNFRLFIFLPFWFHKFHCLTLSHVLLGSSTVSIIIYLFEKTKFAALFYSFHSDLVQLFVSFGPRLEKRYRKDYWSGCFILFVISHSIMSLFFYPRGQFHIPHLGVYMATIDYIRLRHHVVNDDPLEFYGPDQDHFEWKSVIGGLN